eukprot:scaffold42154_cov48-Phaeocystis_antarctica.AAC.1
MVEEKLARQVTRATRGRAREEPSDRADAPTKRTRRERPEPPPPPVHDDHEERSAVGQPCPRAVAHRRGGAWRVGVGEDARLPVVARAAPSDLGRRGTRALLRGAAARPGRAEQPRAALRVAARVVRRETTEDQALHAGQVPRGGGRGAGGGGRAARVAGERGLERERGDGRRRR